MMSEETCELLCIDAQKADALRRGLPDLETLERAADAAKALSDPTRLALAVALRDAGDECCVCDMAFIVARDDKLVSHHLRQLRAAGMVRSRKDGRMVLYALTERGYGLLASVLGDPQAAVR